MEKMNRREFLKASVGGGLVAAAGIVGLDKAEKASSVENDPFYAAYLKDVYVGNQDAIRGGLLMANGLREAIKSNAAALEILEGVIDGNLSGSRNPYEMGLLMLHDRIEGLKLDMKKFADPIDDYYKLHPEASRPTLPTQEQEPAPLPDEIEKGRVSFT